MDLREEGLSKTGMIWSSVFAGSFVFLAVEVTFGMLAAAIFPGTANRTGVLGAGPGIWMIILSIIALYVGAKAASYLSGEVRKLNGMYYGLVTFGLSIFATVLIATMVAGNTANAGLLLGMVTANAAWLFVTLILGGIAAGIGGALGVLEPVKRPVTEERTTLRPVA
jgi:hypothetical protein